MEVTPGFAVMYTGAQNLHQLLHPCAASALISCVCPQQGNHPMNQPCSSLVEGCDTTLEADSGACRGLTVSILLSPRRVSNPSYTSMSWHACVLIPPHEYLGSRRKAT